MEKNEQPYSNGIDVVVDPAKIGEQLLYNLAGDREAMSKFIGAVDDFIVKIAPKGSLADKIRKINEAKKTGKSVFLDFVKYELGKWHITTRAPDLPAAQPDFVATIKAGSPEQVKKFIYDILSTDVQNYKTLWTVFFETWYRIEYIIKSAEASTGNKGPEKKPQRQRIEAQPEEPKDLYPFQKKPPHAFRLLFKNLFIPATFFADGASSLFDATMKLYAREENSNKTIFRTIDELTMAQPAVEALRIFFKNVFSKIAADSKGQPWSLKRVMCFLRYYAGQDKVDQADYMAAVSILEPTMEEDKEGFEQFIRINNTKKVIQDESAERYYDEIAVFHDAFPQDPALNFLENAKCEPFDFNCTDGKIEFFLKNADQIADTAEPVFKIAVVFDTTDGRKRCRLSFYGSYDVEYNEILYMPQVEKTYVLGQQEPIFLEPVCNEQIPKMIEILKAKIHGDLDTNESFKLLTLSAEQKNIFINYVIFSGLFLLKQKAGSITPNAFKNFIDKYFDNPANSHGWGKKEIMSRGKIVSDGDFFNTALKRLCEIQTRSAVKHSAGRHGAVMTQDYPVKKYRNVVSKTPSGQWEGLLAILEAEDLDQFLASLETPEKYMQFLIKKRKAELSSFVQDNVLHPGLLSDYFETIFKLIRLFGKNDFLEFAAESLKDRSFSRHFKEFVETIFEKEKKEYKTRYSQKIKHEIDKSFMMMAETALLLEQAGLLQSGWTRQMCDSVEEEIKKTGKDGITQYGKRLARFQQVKGLVFNSDVNANIFGEAPHWQKPKSEELRQAKNRIQIARHLKCISSDIRYISEPSNADQVDEKALSTLFENLFREDLWTKYLRLLHEKGYLFRDVWITRIEEATTLFCTSLVEQINFMGLKKQKMTIDLKSKILSMWHTLLFLRVDQQLAGIMAGGSKYSFNKISDVLARKPIIQEFFRLASQFSSKNTE